jgi:hypothetical protein
LGIIVGAAGPNEREGNYALLVRYANRIDLRTGVLWGPDHRKLSLT